MKKIHNTSTKELKKLTPEDVANVANIVLEEYSTTEKGKPFKGKSYEDLSEMFKSENSVSPHNAKALFTPFIGVLLEKVLMSTLEELPDLEYMNFVDMFRGEDITEGSAIEHQAQQIGGYIPYDRTAYIPPSANYKNVLSQNISLSSNNFKQIKIPLTINMNELQYYMLSKPKLSQFINQQREALSKTHTLIMFNALMTQITTQTYAKTIQGTATNMFDAVIEVTSAISEMGQISKDFNVVNQADPANNLLTNSSYDELIWIWSLANENKATMGIKSQLYNRDLWGDPITAKMNMVALKSRYDVNGTDPSKSPAKNSTDWVNDSTIYVLNKNAFKINYQLDNVVTSQYYSENMLLQVNINCWFLVSTVNFGQALKYTNANLSTLPN